MERAEPQIASLQPFFTRSSFKFVQQGRQPKTNTQVSDVRDGKAGYVTYGCTVLSNGAPLPINRKKISEEEGMDTAVGKCTDLETLNLFPN